MAGAELSGAFGGRVFTTPVFSMMNRRPSGANAVPTGWLSPLATGRSTNFESE